MHASFEKLPKDKQDRIIGIAVEEFAKHGYDQASTDRITNRAGISKGILFHYFGSKKNLYLYTVKKVIADMTEKTVSAMERLSSKDFFEHIRAIVSIRHQLSLEYEHETMLLMQTFMFPPESCRAEIEELYRQSFERYRDPNMLRRIYRAELLEQSRLRPGLTPERVLSFTMFVVEQFSQSMLMRMRDRNLPFDPVSLEQMMSVFDDYLDMIRYGTYAGESKV